MKKCGGCLPVVAASLFLALAMSALGIWFLIYLLSHPGDFSESEHQEFFLGLLMYFGAAALLIYSTLQSMGNQVEYDEFSLIFRLRRGEERVFSWNELPQKAQLRHVATGLKIRFADDGRECFLSSTMYGFRKFLRVLRDRGLVP